MKQYATHIEKVLTNPTMTRDLKNGRTAFWCETSQTVIVRNPKAMDGGTAFMPDLGVNYFLEVLQ
ncbi:MAG: hypothetical protein H0T62_09580 [Parachlamydiaceae bacterium]|nr:hypothetical protein [Parachlamydiaceae bacterium]